jgi:hypothetical protein
MSAPGTPSDDLENLASPCVSDFSGHQAIFEDFIRCHSGRTERLSATEKKHDEVWFLVEEIYRAAGRTLPVARPED